LPVSFPLLSRREERKEERKNIILIYITKFNI